MRKFFKDFKAFISKGNIIDLAVAVVIGSAFNKIVNTLVNSIIMPFIGWATGGKSVADWKYVITEANEELGIAENAIKYGEFFQAIIDFLIIGLTLFIMVKVFAYSKRKIEKTKEILSKQVQELTKKDKKKLKKAGINVDELQKESETKTVAEATESQKAEPLIELAKPSKEEELLTEIRDLLMQSVNKDSALNTVEKNK